MKLAIKFVLMLLAVITVLSTGYGVLVLRREQDSFDSDMRRDDRLIAKILGATLRRTCITDGEPMVIAQVAEADKSESHVRVRWVHLEAQPGDPFAPRVASSRLAPLLRSEGLVQLEESGGRDGYLFTYLPVCGEGDRTRVLELAESLDDMETYTTQSLVLVVLLTATKIALTTVFAFLIGIWFVGRPVRRLVESSRRVASGDFSVRLEIHQRDELGLLAREVNVMCERLSEARARLEVETLTRIQAVEQLRHADRLRTVGQLTSGIAHELGTPLNVVMARAKMIAGGEVAAAEAKDSAQIIVNQSIRITKIIRQLLDFARPPLPARAKVDLTQIVRLTIGLLEPTARKSRVVLTSADNSPPSFVQADADQIQQVLSNLILNAIQAMSKGGTVTISLDHLRARPPDDPGGTEREFAAIVVRDQGVGIAGADLQRVFEPFYTTKDIGEGTGLGLSVALGMIKEHSGWIGVESEPSRGACFTVYLPRE